MITLYLVKQKVLHRPTLYLSDFFEKHKGLYYDNLTLVRKNSDLTQWIKFFLVAVIETAQNGSNTFRDILSLRDHIEGEKIIKLGRKLSLAKELLFYLYKKPVVTAMDVEEELKISKPTANAILKNFQQLGILKEQTGFKRNRIFIFDQYISLFDR